MNRISVIAHGEEGSFVRRVQHTPHIAVQLLSVLEQVSEALRGAGGGDIEAQLVRYHRLQGLVDRAIAEARCSAPSPIVKLGPGGDYVREYHGIGGNVDVVG